jgi:hypothetical protein
MYGLIFLATGIIDDERDTKIIAPFILAGPFALAFVTFSIFFLSAVGTTYWLRYTGGILIGLGVSYALALTLQRFLHNFIGIVGVRLALILALILGLGYLAIVGALLSSTGASPLAVAAGLPAYAIVLVGFMLCALAMYRASARGLRLTGLLLSLLSISLLLVPPIADVLGTPIK